MKNILEYYIKKKPMVLFVDSKHATVIKDFMFLICS